MSIILALDFTVYNYWFVQLITNSASVSGTTTKNVFGDEPPAKTYYINISLRTVACLLQYVFIKSLTTREINSENCY